jgi:hypothetical protein
MNIQMLSKINHKKSLDNSNKDLDLKNRAIVLRELIKPTQM